MKQSNFLKILNQQKRDAKMVKKIEEGRDITTLCMVCDRAYDKLFEVWTDRAEYEMRHKGKEFYYSHGLCDDRACQKKFMKDYGFDDDEIDRLLKDED